MTSPGLDNAGMAWRLFCESSEHPSLLAPLAIHVDGQSNEKGPGRKYNSTPMAFSLFSKKGSPVPKEESSWKKEDDEALEELKHALREYYNGEDISERSRHLANLKLFGSWDSDSNIDEENEGEADWEDADVQAWKRFCLDIHCFDNDYDTEDDDDDNDNDDEQGESNNDRKLVLMQEAQNEIERTKATQEHLNIWPVTIVQRDERNGSGGGDDSLSDAHVVGVGWTPKRRKSKKRKGSKNKELLHVDVVFVSQDKYHCAHGIEVQATPKDRVRDVYAGQSLALF